MGRAASTSTIQDWRGRWALGLPKGALIVLIGRGNEHLVPDGSTVLEPGDHLLILADETVLDATRQVFAQSPKRTPPAD